MKSWLSVLEASNVVHVLEPYHPNLGKRLVKTPKLYFTDTGLASFLVGFRSAGDLARSDLLGAFFETHVLGQILRWHANRGRRARIHFYRDHQGHEVDFVIPVGEKLKLIECKWAETPATASRGFDDLTRLVGEEYILSRTIVTPTRGSRTVERTGVTVEDSVDLASLAI